MEEAVIENPYLASKRRWNEVLGSTVERARVMTWLSGGLLFSNLCLVGGMWHISSQNKVVPYVMVLNEAMTPVSMGAASTVAKEKQAVTRSFLARFVVDFRTVTPDVSLLNQQIERLYTMLIPGTVSYRRINEYFRENNPYVRASTEGVSVHVVSLIPTSDKAWEVEWIETTSSRRGERSKKRTYRAVLTTGKAVNQDSKAMLHNPFGIVVEAFEYTEKLV